jgi:hypothetical protein
VRTEQKLIAQRVLSVNLLVEDVFADVQPFPPLPFLDATCILTASTLVVLAPCLASTKSRRLSIPILVLSEVVVLPTAIANFVILFVKPSAPFSLGLLASITILVSGWDLLVSFLVSTTNSLIALLSALIVKLSLPLRRLATQKSATNVVIKSLAVVMIANT